jgi:hypothetical protein
MNTQIEQSATEQVDTVEVDALTEALDTLAKAMNKDAAPKSDKSKQVMLFDDEDEETEDSEDDSGDEDEDEDMEDEDEEDMEKSLALESAMRAMAEGTDRIVVDMQTRMNAMMKSMNAMLTEMRALKTEQTTMAKSLGAVMSAPVAPRAAFSAPVEVAPAPTFNRGDMVRKALTQIQDPTVDAARKARLRSAVSLLESGADPRTIDSLVNG